MNKLHTLLLVFSAMTSAKIWADGPELQGSALQAPELNTSSATKESPFKKLMALLAKAKQQKAQGPVAPSLQASAPTQTISSAQDLVSLIRSQGLSFKDALEKMGMGVSKRFSKRLDGKRGQRVFLKKIKKEGLSWQDAAASLKPAAPAEVAPLASTTCPPGSPFDDFEAYLNRTYGCIGKTMSNFLESWKNILDNPLSNNFSDYSKYQEDLEGQVHGFIKKSYQDQYKSILSCSQLSDLLEFEEAFVFQKTDELAKTCLPVVSNVYNSIKNSTDPLAKGLCAELRNDFYKAYRIVEKSLSIGSFDNADSAMTDDAVAGNYTGLTAIGATQASALKSLQEALGYTMDRQGFGRLIYGDKTIAALAAYTEGANPAYSNIANDPDFKFACTNIGIGGTAQVDPCLVTKNGSLINNILTKVPAISTQYFDRISQTLSDVKDLTTYLQAAGYAVTKPGKNQSLTLQLLAAANSDPIGNHYELTEAEKPGAYYMRQLLNGGAASTTWLARNNTVIRNPAPEDAEDNLENRRNRMEEGQENRSESRSARPNNRNNIVWEN